MSGILQRTDFEPSREGDGPLRLPHPGRRQQPEAVGYSRIQADGRVTCPVAGCDCYGTWSVNEESRTALEQARAEYLREQAARPEEPPVP